MMHANSFEAQKFAVDGHVGVIAMDVELGSLDKQTDLPAEIRKVLDQIAEEKIGYQPTLQVMQGLRAYFNPEYLKMRAIPKVIPAEMLEWFESPEGKCSKKKSLRTMRRTRTCGKESTVVQSAVCTSGCLPGGQRCQLPLWHDTPSAPTYGNLPGLNGYWRCSSFKGPDCLLNRFSEPPRSITHGNQARFTARNYRTGEIANLVLLKNPR